MRLAVLTSGGDSPGMNAALRTVTIAGLARGHRVVGIRHGYKGLLAGDVAELDTMTVDGITRYGGTILGSARSAEFVTREGQARARQRLRAMGIDVLVVIGGNGSLTGAHVLATDDPACRVVGLPASIDNDVGHTGLAIGVDTAVNTIVEACDRISDTARAHHRAFLVEVMGRRCGFLAMRAGIAAEADAVLFGEEQISEDEVVARLRQVLRRCFAPGRDRKRALIVKSEGFAIPTVRLAARLRETLADDAPDVDLRETILGHVVRGGNPSAMDRLIAGRLGFAAVLAAERGMTDVMLGWDVPGDFGLATPEHAVRAIPITDVLAETERLLDGSSPIVARRITMLKQVEQMLAF
jgi:6-phosphofructokinase 1